MKKIVSVLLILALAAALTVPAFAEPKYVTTIFQENPKDEEYWDKMFELDKEQAPLPEMPEDLAAALKEQFPDPTPEQVAQWKEQAKQRLEEEKESNRVDMSLESERRGKMMGLVFGDRIHSVDSPDSTFEGSYQEFPGKDGSTTRVYEDGSVDTKYPDGRWEGMDRNGNRITEDKDGNRTVSFLNGDVGTVKDGNVEIKQTDGATVTYRGDGTISWTNGSGLVIDYDETGERTAIGFQGGEKVDLVYGQLPPGDRKITGPNGAYIEWHNGETAELSEDGTSVEIGDGQYGFTIRGADGSTGKLATDTNYNPRIDQAATIAGKQAANGKAGDVYTSDEHVEISAMDGGAYDVTINNDHDDQISVTYEDPDGNVYVDKTLGGGMYEKSFESADGKNGYEIALDETGLNAAVRENGVESKVIETVQDDDGSIRLNNLSSGAGITVAPDGAVTLDAEGLHVETYPNGAPKEYSANGDYVRFDEDGNVTDAHLTGENGGTIDVSDGVTSITSPDGETVSVTQSPDGVKTVTLPDGSVRTQDENGSWNIEGVSPDVEANPPAADAPAAETPSETPAASGFAGCYYGTYDYTAYWDGGKQKQGDRAYYVYEYNGCYYLVQAKDPTEVEALVTGYGVEAFYNNYYDEKCVNESSSFDPATRTATYSERVYMNDVQYIAGTYTITFDGNGGITISWEENNVYQGRAEPHESGTFTGSKK